MEGVGDILTRSMKGITLFILLAGMMISILIASCGGPSSVDNTSIATHFRQSSEDNRQTIDHSAFDEILRTYVQPDRDGINRFAYAEISSTDREALRNYIIGNLALIPITQYRRDEQLAFWINLYNALTIQLVIDNYPVRSIEDIDISPGLFSRGPFGKKLIKIDGINLSLDDIRKRILLPVWKDPRIHYVLTYAAIDSPNIQPRAFTAGTADAIMDQAASAFVNHPRGIRIEDDQIVANSLFIWHAKDFGTGQAFIDHLLRYADFDLAKYLIETDHISRQHFDWAINSVD